MGIEKVKSLAEAFKQEWIINEFIPVVVSQIAVEKKAYNFRMCCLNSLAAVMPYI